MDRCVNTFCRPVTIAGALALALLASRLATAADGNFIFNHLEGEVVAIEPGKITWTDKSNVPHIAFVTKETKVQVTGEIEASAIAPGAYVRFTIPVTPKRLQPIKGAKVEELTLFSPGDGYQLGLLPDNVVDPQAKSVSCLVAGQVKQLKKGLLTLVINGKQFKVTLADEAKVKVDVSDYSIARKGDNIVLTGTGANQREIECKGVEINLAGTVAGDAVNKPAADTKKPKRGAKPTASKPAATKPTKPTKPDAEAAGADAAPADG